MEKDKCRIRTDLVLETGETVIKNNIRNGIEIEEENNKKDNIHITRMRIVNNKASAILNRSKGSYITMKVPQMSEEDEGYHREISKAMAKELLKLINTHVKTNEAPHILVVGLGNRDATADALGPMVVSNLLITRHIIEFMGYDEVEGAKAVVSAIVPGVMAQTGMDTVEIIGAITCRTKPDILLVIDALAARHIERLNSTIQITDTGIHPGSGVGNSRKEITQKTMGIPVIAIGVPTVIDTETLIHDLAGEDKAQGYFKDMYVTSKDIDELVKRISYTISEGINICMGLK